MESPGSRIYFASDFHLGVDLEYSSRERESIIVSWLEQIKLSAKELYLMGDVFDYWFEYRYVVPKGHLRLFGKLCELSDVGVKIHFIKGNHDMWVYSYFEKELGMIIHDSNYTTEIDGRRFFLTHGDGIGSGEKRYKIIRYILRHRLAQKFYACLHPSLGIPLMRKMSRLSRKNEQSDPTAGDKRIMQFIRTELSSQSLDYFICGHIHQPKIQAAGNGKTIYCNLGDWVTHFTYAEWDGADLKLKRFGN